LSKSIFPITVV